VNNEKLKDPINVASGFNNFFVTITKKLNIRQSEKGNAISNLTDSFPGNFPSIKIIPITEAEIKSIIHFLKQKKSSGYDEITIEILKACVCLISHPLSCIYNHSHYTGTFLTVLNFSCKSTLHEGRQN
jgi:hypothetical protein